MSYEEAKDFIKSLDEFAIQYTKMTDWYIPEDWNRQLEPKRVDKLPWEEFYKKFLEGKSEKYIMGVISRIESLVYGNPKKGNINAKMEIIESLYEGLTASQYAALMAKMES